VRAIILAMVLLVTWGVARADEAGWSYYGGDEGGLRYSTAKQITPDNVGELVLAWTYRTGDLDRREARAMRQAKLQVTPILMRDKLLVCSSFNEVIALDPVSGQEKWRFDPKVPTDKVFPANGFNCRGVATWVDAVAADGTVCRTRVLAATNDARVIALDFDTGKPCDSFGTQGQVKINPGMELVWPGEFQITSAPVVIGDVVVVGSAIGDNARVVAPKGVVHAFDIRTGAEKWSWDPVPRDPADPAAATWGEAYKDVGHANVWAPMSVDSRRGLIFLPTSSPSPDFFGGLRPGDNKHANSVVALRGETGELVWAFQTVHHDVWDYDNPAQPTLATIDVNGAKRDVVIEATKQGFVFVLDRDTGVPVFPVEERAVPQGAAAGEPLSPTQPFPTHIPALVPQKLSADDAYGWTPWDEGACRDAIAASRSEGLYTPPSEQGTILFPMTGGGVNWGGISFDPVNQILFANTSRGPHKITLYPAAKHKEIEAANPDKEVSEQRGAPFGMIREVVLSPLGLPCNQPPWGVLTAVDVKSGKVLWESTLGTTEELAPLGVTFATGTPTLGGSLITAGGLVFIGATMDKYLRAFAAKSGAELWQGRLPVTGFATPMSYEYQGRQYVVIAAGGHAELDTEVGDSIVAFTLPREGEAGPTLWSRTIDRPGGRMWVAFTLLFVSLVVFGLLVRLLFKRLRGA
jgi:quinoprotein glucose dehydrogenase